MQFWFCKQSVLLWQINANTWITFPRHTVWSNHQGGYGSEFLDWICERKESLQEMSFWFHPRPCTMLGSAPQSLLWPLAKSVGHCEHSGRPWARSVTSLPSKFINKDIKEASPLSYWKSQKHCGIIISLEALCFPPCAKRRLTAISPSGSVLWHLLTLTAWLWAKRNRDRHSDENW